MTFTGGQGVICCISELRKAKMPRGGACARVRARSLYAAERDGLMARKKTGFDAEKAAAMSSREIGGWLDERERRFAEEYNKDLNGTAAAIRAGYKPGRDNASAAVQASRLLRDERIRAYRVAKIRESMEDQALTAENVVMKLLEIYRRCMAAEPVMTWDSEKHDWVESGVWKFDAKGATKALEQLSRLLGLGAPEKVELSGGALEAFLRGK